MPAPKMPPAAPSATATQAAEALDELLANRRGWTSTDRGWTHKKAGLHVEAHPGTSPFRVTRTSGGSHEFASRVGLDVFLATAGA